MIIDCYGKRYTCVDCNHTINLPPTHCITGKENRKKPCSGIANNLIQSGAKSNLEQNTSKEEVIKNFLEVFQKVRQDNPRDSSRGGYRQNSWRRNRNWVLENREEIRVKNIREALVLHCRECETCILKRKPELRNCNRYVEETSVRRVFNTERLTVSVYYGSTSHFFSKYSPEEFKKQYELYHGDDED